MRVLPVLSLLLLTGCPEGDEHDHHHHHHGHDTSDTANLHFEGVTSAQSDGGSFFVEYTPNPDPIPVSDEFSLTIVVHDGADTETVLSSVDSVAIDADMPEHGHGTNPADYSTEATGDAGSYESVPIDLFMSGLWTLTFTAASGDAVLDETTYSFCLEG